MTRQTVIAYWLVPSEPAHSFFQRIVNDLACRYDAPVFEPHVTIHVGADHADAAANALGKAAQKCELVRLTPLGIDQSDEFIKTLFVQFAMSAGLHLGAGLRRLGKAHWQLQSQCRFPGFLSIRFKRSDVFRPLKPVQTWKHGSW